MPFAMRRLLPAALALLAVAACGSSGTPKPAHTIHINSTSTPKAASSPGAPTGTPSDGPKASNPASSGAPSASGTPGSTAKPAASGSPATKMFARLFLKEHCIVLGGKQHADVWTQPKALVIMDTVYEGKKEGSTQGGLTKGYADDKGHFVYDWIVKPSTQTGAATTVVRTGEGNNRAATYMKFLVAVSCEGQR